MQSSTERMADTWEGEGGGDELVDAVDLRDRRTGYGIQVDGWKACFGQTDSWRDAVGLGLELDRRHYGVDGRKGATESICISVVNGQSKRHYHSPSQNGSMLSFEYRDAEAKSNR